MKLTFKWIYVAVIAVLIFVGVVLSELKYLNLQQSFLEHKDLATPLPSPAAIPSCYKNKPSDSFQICDNLPFTRTECGISARAENGNFLVPNHIIYIWVGKNTLEFFQYLSMRSVASVQKPQAITLYYTDAKPQGELWDRAEREIPCLYTKKIERPKSFKGIRVPNAVKVTDVVRLNLLLQNGGMYLDTDVLVLQSLDPLRKYSMTMGRSHNNLLSSGTILTQPNSPFMKEWVASDVKDLNDFFVAQTMRLHLLRPDLPFHVEQTSMQRPNPRAPGEAKMMHESFNISKNYIFHIHPTFSGMNKATVRLREDKLRVLDTTYGAAARVALFGTQDLIFLKGEENQSRNRVRAKEVKELPPAKLTP